MCHCEDGWKGPECDVPIGECQVPGCNGHGRCIEGDCHCERGWKGQFCELRKWKIIVVTIYIKKNPTDHQSDVEQKQFKRGRMNGRQGAGPSVLVRRIRV